MGLFFDPVKPKEHRCPLPSSRTHNGWRCDCGKAYVVEHMGERDRGVDPTEPNWQWRRAPEHDA